MLQIKNLEKHEKDTLLFPEFNLDVKTGEVAAVYSNLNVRHALLHIFSGKKPLNSSEGDILIDGNSIKDNWQIFIAQLGICTFEDGLYERLTVLDHLKFYKGIYGFKQTFDLILQLTQLETKKNTKIKKLSNSEKRRVHFAKMLIQNPSLYLFEEPELNVDLETKRVFINLIKYIQKQEKSVIILTSNIESAITTAESVYRLDEDGLKKIETEKEEDTKSISTEKETTIPFQFNKIPTRVNEKIVLFDPPEIDYIESNDGQSMIYIKGEVFPSTLTLTNLEERLGPFGFFRCHRSYIVNLQKVREVITWTRNSYSLILDDKNNSSVPLSKTKMASLKSMLGLK